MKPGRSAMGNSISTFSASWFCLSVIVAFLLFSACKKGSLITPDSENTLVVTFNQPGISINMIDSAIVTFTRNGSNTQYLLKMETRGQDLELALESFTSGTWNAEIYIYSKTFSDGRKRLYVKKKTFNTAVNNGRIEMPGPKGLVTDSWRTKMIFSNAGEDIQIFIPQDNTDPSFTAIAHRKKWDYLYIERYAYLKTGESLNLVAAAGWDCDGDCFTGTKYLQNSSAFESFAQTVKGKIYNAGKIKVVMVNYQTNEDLSFEYSYNTN